MKDNVQTIKRRGVAANEVISGLYRDPINNLLTKWNWKVAIISSILRASLFFFVNMKVGLRMAFGSMAIEFIFNGMTAGFYGSLTEQFRHVRPIKTAVLLVLTIPIFHHSLELLVHHWWGTRRLSVSILASISLSIVNSLFSLYAMHRGAFIIGDNRRSLWHDLVSIPFIIMDFMLLVPRAGLRFLEGASGAHKSHSPIQFDLSPPIPTPRPSDEIER